MQAEEAVTGAETFIAPPADEPYVINLPLSGDKCLVALDEDEDIHPFTVPKGTLVTVGVERVYRAIFVPLTNEWHFLVRLSHGVVVLITATGGTPPWRQVSTP